MRSSVTVQTSADHVQGQQRPMQNRHVRDIISCCRTDGLGQHRRQWNRHVQGAHRTATFRGNIGCYTVEQTPPGAAKADVEQTLLGATLADVEQTRHGMHTAQTALEQTRPGAAQTAENRHVQGEDGLLYEH
jgi:hypothetical protein